MPSDQFDEHRRLSVLRRRVDLVQLARAPPGAQPAEVGKRSESSSLTAWIGGGGGRTTCTRELSATRQIQPSVSPWLLWFGSTIWTPPPN